MQSFKYYIYPVESRQPTDYEYDVQYFDSEEMADMFMTSLRKRGYAARRLPPITVHTD